MYRVLIVDDEPEIRQGLRLKADWAELGLTVAGEAGNGSEAMEWLERHTAQIVITDMNMPIMNGVSFLETCSGRYPDIRLIVITGYEDFNYARAAVRHQARDYLLKPVSSSELTEVLMKVVQELDQARTTVDQQSVLEWRLSEYYKEMKEHCILQLVKEGLVYEQAMLERSRRFDLEPWQEIPVRFITVGLLERDHEPEQERSAHKLRLPFELLCRELAATAVDWGDVHVFRDANYPGLMHYIIQEAAGAAEGFSNLLRACIVNNLGLVPTIAYSEVRTGFGEWKEGYMSALLAWNLSHSDQRHETNMLAEDTARQLRRHLAYGELEPFRRVVVKELETVYSQSRPGFVKLVLQLYLLLDHAAYGKGLEMGSGSQLWLRPERVWEFNTPAKAEQFIGELAEKIIRHGREDKEEPDSSAIREAKRFIDENYMYDLTLTMLAERYRYHPTYFSEMFKAQAGTSFIHYVTDIRMKHAVRLLEGTELGLGDIAELTGFSNASYFSSKFKKRYGLSPSEYRNSRQ